MATMTRTFSGSPAEASAWLRRQAWDRDDDVAALERAFRSGGVPVIEGEFRGFLLHSVSGTWLDRVFELSSKLFSPWRGKALDGRTASADNLVTWFGMLLLRAIAPYAYFRRRRGAWHAVTMSARVESSRVVAGLNVLALDYDAPANRPLLRSVRDEVVEIAPGICLGRAHVRARDGAYRVVQWFTLERLDASGAARPR